MNTKKWFLIPFSDWILTILILLLTQIRGEGLVIRHTGYPSMDSSLSQMTIIVCFALLFNIFLEKLYVCRCDPTFVFPKILTGTKKKTGYARTRSCQRQWQHYFQFSFTEFPLKKLLV